MSTESMLGKKGEFETIDLPRIEPTMRSVIWSNTVFFPKVLSPAILMKKKAAMKTNIARNDIFNASGCTPSSPNNCSIISMANFFNLLEIIHAKLKKTNRLMKTLLAKKMTIAFAESVTCGLAAHQLSTVKGTSEVLQGSI